MQSYICLVCGETLPSLWHLSMHIRKHDMSSKEYYDKYLKKEEDGICKVCWNLTQLCKNNVIKQTKFLNIRDGYSEFCCSACSNKHWQTKKKIRKTCYERYGKRNVFMVDRFKRKSTKTMIERYGVFNISLSEYNKKLKREKRIEQIETQYLNGEPLCPNVSIYERECLNILQEKLLVPIFRNFRCIGYFLDGYIPRLNVALEFDEDSHYYQGKLKKKDVERQHRIEKELNCKFVRIRECEYLRDKTRTIEQIVKEIYE